ncbi:putative HECT E3 ubiquitin ligase [Phytophthora cinnamomi]|uniref:putative HECT E3 ubiquitin ligase n=1 Tax=Phytophthora cinnamomi TaxID=4785 RepID=UPI00355A9E26|nr:putative HECT E3 ubiquitin ligase [Phytophthora cinnamomi]
MRLQQPPRGVMIMGAVLAKAPARASGAPAVASKGVFAPASPSKSRVVVPAPTDEQLDLEEELQAKREEEAAEKQKAAVAHVVENLFPYAPVTVQTQKYPSSSPKAGQAYLWITVDEAEIKRRGGGASAVRYPVGVAVDSDGNVFVSEAGSTPKANANNSQIPYKISAENIMDFAANKKAPPVLKPPRLVEAQQTELVVKWKKSMDSTVDRYEVQYRKADSVNNPWAGLAVVTACKHALREFTIELRGQFLKFMTGTNKIPLDGFEPPLNLTKSDLDPQALPRTHTCFNQLVLPEYTSYETLVEKITFAITNAEGFELS